MRVIHGIWAHGALCLWAEDPDLPPVLAGPPHDVHLPRPHPFACQAAELADMLAGRPGAAGDAARKAVHDELILQLPSAGGGSARSAGFTAGTSMWRSIRSNSGPEIRDW